MSPAIFLPEIVTTAPGDPYFSSVVQLAHFDGANGSQVFTNSCSRGTTFTSSGSGEVISTAQFVFGQSYRKGSATGTVDRLRAGISADYRFGTSDWTIEFRWRTDTLIPSVGGWIFTFNDNNAAHATPSVYYTADGALHYYVNNVTQINTATGAVTAATWYALAVCRVSGTTRLFVNGTSAGSFSDSTNYNYTSTEIDLTNNSAMSNPGINSNFDEFRVTNGVGRYSGTYTPAAAPFPNR